VVGVKSNVVAYHAAEPANVKSRGRPKKYGEKASPKDLFKNKSRLSLGTISGYDDKEVIVKYCSLDLLWKSVGRVVRFVLVQYPNKGRCIFMTTDLNLEPLTVIEMYTKRFKIETSFKQSVCKRKLVAVFENGVAQTSAITMPKWMKAVLPNKS
jgi:hypothetical protein